MKYAQFFAAAAFGMLLFALALSQTSPNQSNQSQQSTTQTQSGSGRARATASSSASAGGRAGGHQSAAGSASGARLPKPTHTVSFFQTDLYSDEAYRQVRTARMQYFARLQSAGKLLYFGPYREETQQLSILVCLNDSEARQIAAEDPAVQQRLLRAETHGWSVEVEPFTPVLANVR